MARAIASETIQVSEEMVAVIGNAEISVLPEDPITFALHLMSADGSATLTYLASSGTLRGDVVLIVARTACERIFGGLPPQEGVFHIPPALRAVALAILHCPLPEPARTTLRLAKAIETLCETFQLFESGAMVPATSEATLAYRDCQRIHAARRIIETRWDEKLTLDSIALACGLNRSKLARGFRHVFASSVADAIAEQRLGHARQMLVATELPVGAIGYRCGYLNNAAFTRAFARRYGVPPTGFRAASLVG
ncbi:MAG TPA: AraC family transcriptional regulator [Allosphingosinicella sp.]|jgi:AraC family transcriptional activator of pyochelin receptor